MGSDATNPIISGWTKTSFIDYPGSPATLLFLSGCNLRCPYCHNPGIVNGEYEVIPFEAIEDHIAKRKNVIEAAVISGGEPTLYLDLADLCDKIKSLGLKVKIDTNGLEPDVLTTCRPDYLALDIKTALDKYHKLNSPYGDNDNRERLSKSIDIVKSMGENAEIRITAAPGIVDQGDIESLCTNLRGVSKVFIQQFNPNQPMLDPAYSLINPYGIDELESMRTVFLEAGINCAVRG
jgi:pyruvate formate lyase activating enzyme